MKYSLRYLMLEICFIALTLGVAKVLYDQQGWANRPYTRLFTLCLLFIFGAASVGGFVGPRGLARGFVTGMALAIVIVGLHAIGEMDLRFP